MCCVFAYFFASSRSTEPLKSTNVILKSTANIDQEDTDYANDDNTFDVDDTISIKEGRDGDKVVVHFCSYGVQTS